jgi:hypothetical protein
MKGPATAITSLQPAPTGEGTSVEPYITKAEVAGRLGRTPRCVELMMARGILPFYRWDSQPAFRWSEVQLALTKYFHVGCDMNGTSPTAQNFSQGAAPHPSCRHLLPRAEKD